MREDPVILSRMFFQIAPGVVIQVGGGKPFRALVTGQRPRVQKPCKRRAMWASRR